MANAASSEPGGTILGFVIPKHVQANGDVFGRALTDLMPTHVDSNPESENDHDGDYNEPDTLPAVGRRCIEYLDEWGTREIGIYRIPGSNHQVTQLRQLFDTGLDVDLRRLQPSELDPHSVASIFKCWLRELPESLLTTGLEPRLDELMLTYTGYPATARHSLLGSTAASAAVPISPTIHVDGASSSPPPTPRGTMDHPPRELLKALRSSLLQGLPRQHIKLLTELARHLAHLAAHSEYNKMPLDNLRLIFSPTLRMSPAMLQILVEQRHELLGDDAPPPTPEKDRTLRINTLLEDAAMAHTLLAHFPPPPSSSQPPTPSPSRVAFESKSKEIVIAIATPPLALPPTPPPDGPFGTTPRASAIVTSSTPPPAVPLPPTPSRVVFEAEPNDFMSYSSMVSDDAEVESIQSYVMDDIVQLEVALLAPLTPTVEPCVPCLVHIEPEAVTVRELTLSPLQTSTSTSPPRLHTAPSSSSCAARTPIADRFAGGGGAIPLATSIPHTRPYVRARELAHTAFFHQSADMSPSVLRSATAASAFASAASLTRARSAQALNERQPHQAVTKLIPLRQGSTQSLLDRHASDNNTTRRLELDEAVLAERANHAVELSIETTTEDLAGTYSVSSKTAPASPRALVTPSPLEDRPEPSETPDLCRSSSGASMSKSEELGVFDRLPLTVVGEQWNDQEEEDDDREEEVDCHDADHKRERVPSLPPSLDIIEPLSLGHFGDFWAGTQAHLQL